MHAAFAHFAFRLFHAWLFTSLVLVVPTAAAMDRSLTLGAAAPYGLVDARRRPGAGRVARANRRRHAVARQSDGPVPLRRPAVRALPAARGPGVARRQCVDAASHSRAVDSGSAIALGASAGGTTAHLRHFGRADGLPSGTVTAVTIDPHGRTWVGTTTGLARFDGRRWSRPTRGRGLSDRRHVCVAHRSRRHSLGRGRGRHVAPPRDGARFLRSTRSISFAWLAERADGRVWESNGTQGVWPLPAADSPPPLTRRFPGPATSARCCSTATVRCGSAAGRRRARSSIPTSCRLLGADGEPQAAPSQRFSRDQDGLSGDEVLAILEDREGDLWLAHQRRPRPFPRQQAHARGAATRTCSRPRWRRRRAKASGSAARTSRPRAWAATSAACPASGRASPACCATATGRCGWPAARGVWQITSDTAEAYRAAGRAFRHAGAGDGRRRRRPHAARDPAPRPMGTGRAAGDRLAPRRRAATAALTPTRWR